MNKRALGSVFDLAVDVGTSPHGLSDDLPLLVRKHAEGSGRPLSAKPVLTAPEVYHSEKVRSACRVIEAAAAEHHYPLVLTGSQMKHIERAISLALDDAIEALDCEPAACHHEIQPDIDAYNEIHLALRLSRENHKAHKGQPNENWRGGEL